MPQINTKRPGDMPTPGELWTLPQLARWWDVDHNLVYRLANRGVLLTVRDPKNTSPKLWVDPIQASEMIASMPAIFRDLSPRGQARVHGRLASLNESQSVAVATDSHHTPPPGRERDGTSLQSEPTMPTLQSAPPHALKVAQVYAQRLNELYGALIKAGTTAETRTIAHTLCRTLELPQTVQSLLGLFADGSIPAGLQAHQEHLYEAMGDASAWGLDTPIGRCLSHIYTMDLSCLPQQSHAA